MDADGVSIEWVTFEEEIVCRFSGSLSKSLELFI